MRVTIQRRFDFNFTGLTGLSGIIVAKGLFPFVMVLFLTLIFVIAFTTIPWVNAPQIGLVRGLILLFLLLIIIGYCKFVTGISFENDHMVITTWKKGVAFPLADINFIRVTYYSSWGIARFRVKQKDYNTTYFLWAPSFDRERYDLYMDLAMYIDEHSKSSWGVDVGTGQGKGMSTSKGERRGTS